MINSFGKICVWTILAAFAGCIAAYSIAGIKLGSSSDPSLAFAPLSEVRIKENNRLLDAYNKSESKEELGAKIEENAKVILRLAPLNDDALRQLALMDIFKDSALDQPAYLETSLERSARNRQSLRVLLFHYYEKRQYAKMLDLLDLLYRLDEKNTDYYHLVLDDVYKEPDGQAVFFDYLTTRPTWADRFVIRKFREEKNNLGTLEELITVYFDGAKDPLRNTALVKVYVRRLLEEGKYEKSYQVWREYGFGAPSGETLNFNPNFQSLPAVAPFNWALSNWENSGAEYDAVGGVYVYFDAPVEQELLRQIMPLRDDNPQELRFLYSGTGSYAARNGELVWEFRCGQDREAFLQIPIDPKQFAADRTEIDITLPRPCDFLDLRLKGKPSLYTDRIAVTFEDVSIKPLPRETRL